MREFLKQAGAIAFTVGIKIFPVKPASKKNDDDYDEGCKNFTHRNVFKKIIEQEIYKFV